MKKVILCAAFLVGSFAVNAQQIQLDEAKVVYTPQVVKVQVEQGDSTYKVEVQEASKGEFRKDPIAFMKKNLDLNSLIEWSEGNTQPFSVTFISPKGKLIAYFDKEGELLKTSQNFKNIILPLDLREDLYRDYKGWEMVKNKYVAKGNASSKEKEVYHVKLKKGNLTKNIKIKKEEQGYAVAMN